MPNVPSLSRATRRFAGDHPSLEKVGRAGWAAKGAVYLIAGLLSLFVTAKSFGWSTSKGNQEASPTGALKTVAGASGGRLLLWLLAIGMLLYAIWRLISALLPGDGSAKTTAKRIGFVISAIIYTSLAITAMILAKSHSNGSSGTAANNANGNSKVTDISARVMLHTAGRLLIGVIGVIVIAVGLYRIGKGIKQDVADELDLSGMSSTRVLWSKRLGAIGECGRGLGIGLIGFFLLRAAITFDPNQATGLDGALRRLATNSWGALVVGVIGVGFLAYGIFCLSTFTHRRLESP